MSRKFTGKEPRNALNYPDQAKTLLKIRLDLQLSRTEIAKRIGVSDSRWGYWERGNIKMPDWAKERLNREFSGTEQANDDLAHLTENDRQAVANLLTALRNLIGRLFKNRG